MLDEIALTNTYFKLSVGQFKLVIGLHVWHLKQQVCGLRIINELSDMSSNRNGF